MKKKDPTSHRIIEKRRRDRMNNCLADLSKLIPAHYMKKGRGRVEKTEIIEMAIKHLKDLIEATNAQQQALGSSPRRQSQSQDQDQEQNQNQNQNQNQQHPTSTNQSPASDNSSQQQRQFSHSHLQHHHQPHLSLSSCPAPQDGRPVGALSESSLLHLPQQSSPASHASIMGQPKLGPYNESRLRSTQSAPLINEQDILQQSGTLACAVTGKHVVSNDLNTGRYLCNNSSSVNHRNISNNRHHHYLPHYDRSLSIRSSSSDFTKTSSMASLQNGFDNSSNSSTSSIAASSSSAASYTSLTSTSAGIGANRGGNSRNNAEAAAEGGSLNEFHADYGFGHGNLTSESRATGNGPASNSSSSDSSTGSSITSASTGRCCTYAARSSTSTDGNESGGSNGDGNYSSSSSQSSGHSSRDCIGGYGSSAGSPQCSSASSLSSSNRNHTVAWYKKAWLVRSFSPQR